MCITAQASGDRAGVSCLINTAEPAVTFFFGIFSPVKYIVRFRCHLCSDSSTLCLFSHLICMLYINYANLETKGPSQFLEFFPMRVCVIKSIQFLSEYIFSHTISEASLLHALNDNYLKILLQELVISKMVFLCSREFGRLQLYLFAWIPTVYQEQWHCTFWKG